MTTAFFLLILAATGLTAGDSPSFLIETIEVRGLKEASPAIVVSESLLREGTVYSEQQLRDAERRLRRLPFVFDVEMRLERGSQPGAYLLAIQIVETKAWFFGFGADPRYLEDAQLTVGRRWFLRPNGVAHAAARSDYQSGSLEIGYTMYDLFDRAAVASLNLRMPVDERGRQVRLRGPSPELTFVLPLTHRQALRLQYNVSFLSVQDRPGEARRSAHSQALGTSWQYRSVDDPFFPRHGSDIESGLHFFDSTVSAILVETIWIPGQPEPTVQFIGARRQGAVLSTRGHRYFDIGRQISVVAVPFAEGGSEWVDLDGDTSALTAARHAGASAEASLSGSFWSEEKARERGPFRWEASVGTSTYRTTRLLPGTEGSRWTSTNVDYLRLSVGRRNPWGIYRFSASYFGPRRQ